MNTYAVAKRLVKAIESDPVVSQCVDITKVVGRAESLAGWGQDGVRILSNVGGFYDHLYGSDVLKRFWVQWLQANAPSLYAEPCDGGEVLTLYNG